MGDAHDLILDQRNWLERIVQRVPGFRGYFGAENRREADRVLRDFGVTRLDQVVSLLQEHAKEAALEDLQELRDVINGVEKVRNELRFADRGYAGFFSEIKWDAEDLLDAVYRNDEQIVESALALAVVVEAHDYRVGDLRLELRALERALSERRSSILGLLGEATSSRRGE